MPTKAERIAIEATAYGMAGVGIMRALIRTLHQSGKLSVAEIEGIFALAAQQAQEAGCPTDSVLVQTIHRAGEDVLTEEPLRDS